MIKKYLEFINENYDGFDTLGEWVSSLFYDDYVRDLVQRYTGDINPQIDLENAINILDTQKKNELKYQIDKYLKDGLSEEKPEVLVSTDLEELTESVEITTAGKGIFTSFLKCLTSLGLKESQPHVEKCPNDFLLFYYFPNLEYSVVKQIFSRFKSLLSYIDLMDYGKNEVSLYFGLKCDGEFQYGFYYEEPLPIGKFKLTQSVIRWICQLDSKSASSLKKEIVNLTSSDILTFGSIKTDMESFQPGYFEKRLAPQIKDRVISFGYYGIGKWDNGKLDEGELQNIKNNFTTWVLSKKWGGKVLLSVKPMSFWVYLHIKLK
jgi:hypothetical protein